MPANRAGRGAGRVQQHRIEWAALPLGCIGADRLGSEAEPRQILPQPAKPRLGAVDGGDARASGGELGSLSARGGAEIGDGSVGDIAKESGGKRGGRVLHPPGALIVTRQLRHLSMHRRPQRAGRKDTRAERLRPARGVALDSKVERWLLRMGSGDGAGDFGAVIAHPARHQPSGRIEGECVDPGEALRALLRDPPQHRIGEAAVVRGPPVRACEPHREIDGGVVGDIEKEDLRGPDQQRRFKPRCVGRKTPLKKLSQQVTERAEPPQRDRNQRARQRPVALRKARQAGVPMSAVELLVERPTAAQDAIQQVGGDGPRGKAGRIGRMGASWDGHGAEKVRTGLVPDGFRCAINATFSEIISESCRSWG